MVVAIVGLLASLLLPALSKATSHGRMASCLSNKRQLAITWQLFIDDNGVVPANGFVPADGNLDYPMWVQGYYNVSAAPRDSTNVTLLLDPRYSQFANYNKELKIYKCPGDKSRLNEVLVKGVRPRSVGLNWFLGWVKEVETIAPPGNIYRRIEAVPDPAGMLLMTDVHDKSICWPFFGINATDVFFMIPGFYHNGSTVSFTDGHAINKRWLDPRTKWAISWHSHNHGSPDNRDLNWLRSVGTDKYILANRPSP